MPAYFSSSIISNMVKASATAAQKRALPQIEQMIDRIRNWITGGEARAWRGESIEKTREEPKRERVRLKLVDDAFALLLIFRQVGGCVVTSVLNFRMKGAFGSFRCNFCAQSRLMISRLFVPLFFRSFVGSMGCCSFVVVVMGRLVGCKSSSK